MTNLYAIQTGRVRVRRSQILGSPNIFTRCYDLFLSSEWSEWLPIWCFLIEKDNERILIDTGETSKILDKTYIPQRHIYHRFVETEIRSEHELDRQLRRAGIAPEEITTILLTHLHNDHIGGLYLFPQAKVMVSKSEFQIAAGKWGPSQGYFNKNWPSFFRPDYYRFADIPEGFFSQSMSLTSDGDIVVVPTPGHSVGHVSFIIKSLGVVLGGDATLDAMTLQNQIPDTLFVNKDARNSVNTLKQYVENTGFAFISSHDKGILDLIKRL